MDKGYVTSVIITILLVLSSACDNVKSETADTKNKPNIIFILADDLGYGDVGFNGQDKILTPHLDQMAKEGMVLSHFYAGAPVCGPSRATLMYGQHTGHCSIRGNPRWTKSGKPPEMKADDIILPKELKRAGYSTALFGKWGLNEDLQSNIGHPLKQGFDEFVGFNTHKEAHYHWPDFIWEGYKKVDLSAGEVKGNWNNKLKFADDIFTEKCLDYIDRKAGKETFFIYLAYTIPHKGYTSPEESRKPYESQGWPVIKIKSGHYEMDPETHTAYAGMISRMDSYLGQIRQKLKDKGVDKKTLIIFTSDNGHELSSDFFNSGGGLRGKKRDLTEGGIHMPTVALWPGTTQAGSTNETALAFWDVLPTLCDIVGITSKVQTDGISFLPALKGQKDQQKEHDVLYWEFNESKGPQQAIRFSHWKAIRLWDASDNKMGSIELYDLKKDIAESTNVAAQHPQIVSKALELFVSSRTEHPEFPLVPKKNTKKKKKSK